MSEQLLYKIAVNLLPDIGPVNGKKLIAYCGGPEAIFTESKSALLKIPGIGRSLVNSIINHSVFERAEEEIEFILKEKISAHFFLDKAYPKRLKHCIDGPLMVYYKGNIDLNQKKMVSIVGTRRATVYGKHICEQIIKEFKDQDITVVSGLAYGIDTYAHRFALKYDQNTIGVVAHGLDNLYPSQNKNLSEQMLEQGGLITEFMSKTKMDPSFFPRRNRIIAGMTDATIVVEAAKKGGALITADIANSYNRDVFAVPGRIGDSLSEGCNLFIRNHKAALLQGGKDLLYIMNWQKEKKTDQFAQRQLFVDLTRDDKKIVDILQKGELGIDDIMLQSGLAISKLSAVLLNLEFKGVLISLPGKLYRLV